MSLLQELLDAAGLTRISAEIMHVALPSIRLKAYPVEETQLEHLLGHPDVVQWDMHGDLEGAPREWQLLFQVDSDAAPDTEWGDTGRIYYWIRRRDLAKRDFSGVELILQSS